MSLTSGRILVPLDGSAAAEQMLHCAAHLAGPLAMGLVLLRVVDEEHLSTDPTKAGSWYRTELIDPATAADPSATSPELLISQAIVEALGEAETHLEGVAAPLRKDGMSVDTHVLDGRPGPAILSEAAARAISLIAMMTHGRAGLARTALGSVAGDVIRQAPCPVLVARPEDGAVFSKARWQEILLPLDGTAYAERAIPVATEVASALRRPVRLSWVVPASDANSLVAAQRYLDDWAERLALKGVSATGRSQSGDAADELAGLAKPEILVVMCTHGRTGLGRELLGSVADAVVTRGNAAVLLLPRQAGVEGVATR